MFFCSPAHNGEYLKRLALPKCGRFIDLYEQFGAQFADVHYRFTADTAFESPSGAGGAVYGGSVNGRRYWKHLDSGQSYGDWRKARLES